MRTKIVFFSFCVLSFIIGDAHALMWNDPGITPVQSISDHRWRDANTGRLINVTGMPGVGANVQNTPNVTSTGISYTTTATNPGITYSTSTTGAPQMQNAGAMLPAVATAVPQGNTNTAGTAATPNTTPQTNPATANRPQTPNTGNTVPPATAPVTNNAANAANNAAGTAATPNAAPQTNPATANRPQTPNAGNTVPPARAPVTNNAANNTAGTAQNATPQTNTAGNTQNPPPANATNNAANSGARAPRVRSNWSNMTTGAKVGAALGVAGGAAGIYASTTGKDEHDGWDIAGGAASGAIAGASIGSIFPGIGTALGAGIGAIIGGLIPGSKVFSETDCLRDPVTGLYTCCNTAIQKGERQVPIGGYMFCGVDDQNGSNVALPPGVRQCLQGKIKDESTWSDQGKKWYEGGLWVNDFWQPECVVKYCSTPPTQGIEAYIEYIPDTQKFCWEWDCIDGYTRSGNTCVNASTNSTANPYTNPGNPNANQYDELIKQLQIQRDMILQECGNVLNNTII